METQTKDEARKMVKELERELEYLAYQNSATYFAQSLSWHPRWHLIFSLIRDVREEYEILLPLRQEIRDMVLAGETYTIEDWGNGWEWRAEIVDVGGYRIRVCDNMKCCLYKGQHDRPVIHFD